MERYRHLLLLGAALLVALLASVIAYRVLQRRAERTEAAAETRPVAVAAVNLSPGMEIRAEMVGVAPFLGKSLPANATFATAAEIVGRVVLSPVQIGEPIFRSRVTGQDAAGAGVSALISVGKRAMAVKVDKIIGVSGFIRPQNRVDVMVTLGDPGSDGKTITKIVLENMLVLAAGTEFEKKPGAEKAVPVDVITFEVTPEEAEKLTLAASSGRIQLALRNLKDGDPVRTEGSTVNKLLGYYTTAERRALAKEAPAGAAGPTSPAPPTKPPPAAQRALAGGQATGSATAVWVINGSDTRREMR